MCKKCEQCGKAIEGTKRFCSKECYRKSLEQDITGKVFGNLKVIGRGTKRQHLLCKCVCGNVIERHMHTLKSCGNNQSCGCLAKGGLHLSGTQFYYKFQGILNRCNNKDYKCYKNYGGKGIKCEWNDIKEFYNDMYYSYLDHIKQYGEKNTTLDRIDNSKNYCKENCRRATIKEQANNKTNNVILEYKGEKHNITEWAEKLGMTFATLYQRLYKGMDLAFIIENPDIKCIKDYEQLRKY